MGTAIERSSGRQPISSGRRKAAVLLVTLGSDHAAEVFKHLREDEIESLSLEMAKLYNVEPEVTGSVLEEFSATVTAYDSFVSGGVDYAREVLERALGEDRAAEIFARLSIVIEMRPFQFMRRTPPEQIVNFLRNESPQVVALVIANLQTQLAAQVLANLPEHDQAEIALRIARMGETNPDVLKEVESIMRQKLGVRTSVELVRLAIESGVA